jgi:hypothetical protein
VRTDAREHASRSLSAVRRTLHDSGILRG